MFDLGNIYIYLDTEEDTVCIIMLSVVSAVLLRRFILLEKYLDFEISLFGRSNLVYRIGLSLINFLVVLKEF